MDAFGWGLLGFLAALGAGWWIYFDGLRKKVASWPQVEATIERGFYERRSQRGIPYLLCVVPYSFLVDGEYFSESLRLFLYSEEAATTLLNEVFQTKLIVCYEPKNPARSYPVEKQFRGFPIVSELTWWGQLRSGWR